MSFIEGGVAFMGLLFATILSALALWRRWVAWMDEREQRREEQYSRHVVEAMMYHGLIKDGTPEDMWPNGSKNMPDFLTTLWESTEAAQAGLHELKRQVENTQKGSPPPKV